MIYCQKHFVFGFYFIMENSKSSWTNDFKKKMKKTETNEYWLNEYTTKNEGMETKETDDLQKMKKIDQMEMENYKHVELLQNISILKDDFESVIEGGFINNKIETENFNNETENFNDETENFNGMEGDISGDKDGDDGSDYTGGNSGVTKKTKNDDDDDDDTGVNKIGNDILAKTGWSKEFDKKVKQIFGEDGFFSDSLGIVAEWIAYAVDILDGDRLNELYLLITNGFANGLSNNKANKYDKKIIYDLFCYLIVLIMSMCVFTSFYFLYFFREWKTDDYYQTVYDYYREKLKTDKYTSTILGVPIDTFITTITAFHFLFSYIPKHIFNIRDHMILPYVYLIIVSFVDSVNQGFLPFLRSCIVLDMKKISKTPMYTILLMITLFYVFLAFIPFIIRLLTSPASIFFNIFMMVLWVIMTIFISPLIAFFMLGCYFIYHVFLILFVDKVDPTKPVPVGNISYMLFNRMVNQTYEYIEKLDKPKCNPASDSCTGEQFDFFKKYFKFYLYDKIIDPAHLFFIRHFISANFVFFSFLVCIHSFYIKNNMLRTILMTMFSMIGILTMIAFRWFNPMEIIYTVKNGKIPENLALFPLLGFLIIMMVCLYNKFHSVDYYGYMILWMLFLYGITNL